MGKIESCIGANNVERFISSLSTSFHFEMTSTWYYPGADKHSYTSSDPMLLNEHLESFIRSHPEHIDRIIDYCADYPIGEFEEDLVPLMNYLELHPSLAGGNL
jgi:hypothetical protein